MDCIFCKIIAGQVPCDKIWENDEFLAFLDISQNVEGHTLVIPKEHVRWVWDATNPGGYGIVVTKIAKALQKTFNTEWVTSAVAGEMVHHAHVHLFPRHEDDEHGAVVDFTKKADVPKEKMAEIAKNIGTHV